MQEPQAALLRLTGDGLQSPAQVRTPHVEGLGPLGLTVTPTEGIFLRTCKR